MSISAMILLLTLMMISVFPKPYDKLITNAERTREAAKNGARIGFAVSDPHLTSSTLAPQHLQHPPLLVFSTDKPEVQAVDMVEQPPKHVGVADKWDTSNTNARSELGDRNFSKEQTRLNDKLSVSDDICFELFEDKDYDFESSISHMESKGVVDRLSKCKQYWYDTVNPPLFVSGILNHGYVIPFKSVPPPIILRNNRSSLNHSEFVVGAIKKLLDTGSIREHINPPYVVNPLTVAEGKKLRLVLDLRHINQFTHVAKFQYEGLDTLANMFDNDFYFFSFDLESGYHHINIFEPHHKFLGFSWIFGNTTRYFTFSVLPFGLNTASHCFTKMLRPWVKRWRSMGHCSIMYIDDGISGHADKISAIAASKIVQKDLLLSGFKVNDSKSDFIPKQSGQWLGMIIDSVAMTFSLPDKKLKNILHAIRVCLDRQSYYIRVRDIARIAGFIISAAKAIGRLSRLFTRHLYRAIESRMSWSSKVILSPGAIGELQFWYLNLININGQSIKPVQLSTSAIYSDASDSGFGGFSVQFNDLVCSGLWSDSEKIESSTHREIRAVLYMLRSLGSKLRGMKLKWFSDSQNACRIIAVGSTNVSLHDLSIDLYNCCIEYNIVIQPEWLPRDLNVRADELSKIIDPDDWSLNREVFVQLDNMFGPHSIDRFACHYNTQLRRFNSRYWNPGCEAADCLTQDWSGENNWVCPPASMVLTTIRHMRKCHAKGTVIVPVWPSAPFWPILSPKLGSIRKYMIHSVLLPNRIDLCIPGRGQRLTYRSGKCMFQGSLPFQLMAIRYDFGGP